MNANPNPGSDAAIAAGCTCPVMDNAHGRGVPMHGAPVFWIAEGCPLHADRLAREAVEGREPEAFGYSNPAEEAAAHDLGLPSDVERTD